MAGKLAVAAAPVGRGGPGKIHQGHGGYLGFSTGELSGFASGCGGECQTRGCAAGAIGGASQGETMRRSVTMRMTVRLLAAALMVGLVGAEKVKTFPSQPTMTATKFKPDP